MKYQPAKARIEKLKLQLRRLRIALIAAIELGDCRAVARLTCEVARLRDRVLLARTFGWEGA
jgi:hypothetical protein